LRPLSTAMFTSSLNPDARASLGTQPVETAFPHA